MISMLAKMITAMIASNKSRNGLKNAVIIICCIVAFPLIFISGVKYVNSSNEDIVNKVIAEVKEAKKIDNILSAQLVIAIEFNVHRADSTNHLEEQSIRKHIIDDYIKQEKIIVEVEHENEPPTYQEQTVFMFKTRREILDFVQEKYHLTQKTSEDIAIFLMANNLIAVTEYTGDFLLPSKSGQISCSRFCYDDHLGTDIASAPQTEILASATGTVIYTENSCVEGDIACGGGFGNYVVLAHNISGIEYVTIYAHMSEVLVYEKQKVIAGATLGLMGNTGKSTGVHVHFEIIKDVSHFPSWSERYVHGIDTETVITYPKSW